MSHSLSQCTVRPSCKCVPPAAEERTDANRPCSWRLKVFFFGEKHKKNGLFGFLNVILYDDDIDVCRISI